MARVTVVRFPGGRTAELGLEGIFLGLVAGNALAVFYGATVVAQDLRGRISGVELRRMLAELGNLPFFYTAREQRENI